MFTPHEDDDQDRDRVSKARAIRMKCIAFDTRLSSTAIRLATVLYYGCLDRRTGKSEYGQNSLALAIGAKVRTIQNVVRELENAGHVHVDRYKGKDGTNVVTWLPPTQADIARMRSEVNAFEAEEAADREERAKSRARQSEKIVRLKGDEAGKKIPAEQARPNPNRKNFTGSNEAQSERNDRGNGGPTGRKLPTDANHSVGRNIPVEGAQPEEFCRQSYKGQKSTNKISDLESSYWQ